MSVAKTSWQVIVLTKPAQNEYILGLNLANEHLGGTRAAAGNPGEPILFMHDVNWILHVPSGRENARVVVSHLAGRFQALNLPFTALVQGYKKVFRTRKGKFQF